MNEKGKLEQDFMNSDTVAELLCVKKGTIYSWLHYKQLPEKLYRKLGRKILFIRKEVLDWFYAGAELKKRPNNTKPI